jgi:hypothetical protein
MAQVNEEITSASELVSFMWWKLKECLEDFEDLLADFVGLRMVGPRMSTTISDPSA